MDNKTELGNNLQTVIKDKEFTPRAIIWGVVLGLAMLTLFLYMLVITGMGMAVSPLTALLGLILVPLIGGKTCAKEINIVQTIASAVATGCTSAAATIPAVLLLGFKFDWLTFGIVLLIANVVGVCSVAWLRKQTIEDPTLTFPQAVVCVNVLQKADNPPKDEKRLLIIFIVVGALISSVINIFHLVPSTVSFSNILPKGMLLGIELMPMLMSIGYLIGFQGSIMLLGGGLLANLVLAPIGTRSGWYPDPKTAQGLSAMQNYNLSIVVGIAVIGVLIPIIKSRKTFAAAFKFKNSKSDDKEMPVKLINIVCLVTMIIAVIFFRIKFGLNPILVFVAMIFMIAIAIMDIRSMGETGLTVAGLLDLILVFILGSLLKNAVITLFLMTLALNATGLAGNTMTDWKSGSLIGASQRKQLWCQFIGLIPGVIFGVLMLYVIIKTRGLGTASAPFPLAKMYYGVTAAATGGAGAVGIISYTRLVIGGIIGAVIGLLGLPAVALGLSLYLPIGYLVSIGIGGIIRRIIERSKGKETAERWVNAASGLMLADGLVSVAAMFLMLFAGK